LKAKIAGVIIVLIQLLWMFEHLQYLYLYQNPHKFWLYMYPTWYLILNSFIGFIGVIVGIRVFQEKTTILIGFFYTVILISLGLSTDLIRNF